MIEQQDGYALNRKRSRDVQRVITELPSALVREVDEWGVAVGMTSRREATEALLREGLRAAGGEFGDQAPAAVNNSAALAGGVSINADI